MLALASFRSSQASDFSAERQATPSFAAELEELRILGEITACVFEVVTMQSANAPGTFLNLISLNRRAAELAHLYLVCFRANGAAFVPCQHYYNVQITMRGKYVSQAVSISENLEEYWWYQDSDDREEGMFGMLRTLSHGSNFDMIQFEERACELMRLEEIYCRRPELRKGSRRLSGPLFDHLNPRSIGRACALLGGLSLPNAWLLGSGDASRILSGGGVFTHNDCNWVAISSERYGPTATPPDMLRPRGKYVGVTENDDDYNRPSPAARASLSSSSRGGGVVAAVLAPRTPSEDEVDSWLNLEEDLDDEADEQLVSHDGEPQSRLVRLIDFEINGTSIPDITAEKATRLFFSRKLSSSTERIHRVMSRRKAGTNTTVDEDEVETELIARVSPLRLLCDSPSGVSLVIILPTSFDVSRGKGLDYVSLSELHETNAFVYGHVLRPSKVSGGDDGSLHFKSTMLGEMIKSRGTVVQPCSPAMVIAPDGTPTWQFPIFSLTVMHALHWDEFNLGRGTLSMIKEPYVDASSSAIFIIEGTESEGLPTASAPQMQGVQAELRTTQPGAAQQQTSIPCPICAMLWSSKMMLHHMGAHLLEESWARYNKEKPTMPCMLCGVGKALGEHMMDPSEAHSWGACPISIGAGSTKAVKKAVHQCSLVGNIEYSMKSAETSTDGTPCTNRPMQCLHCPQVFASYSMAQHYSDKHSTTAMPGALQAAAALGKHERAHVMQLLKKRKVASICGGVACCPKAPKARKQQ